MMLLKIVCNVRHYSAGCNSSHHRCHGSYYNCCNEGLQLNNTLHYSLVIPSIAECHTHHGFALSSLLLFTILICNACHCKPDSKWVEPWLSNSYMDSKAGIAVVYHVVWLLHDILTHPLLLSQHARHRGSRQSTLWTMGWHQTK
jgi:hypothetical protein